jgi:hypothetical protein
MDWSVTYDGKPLDPRNDLYSHSPDSFSWGYFGSGPAQLAFVMLAPGRPRSRSAETISNASYG